MQKINLVGQKFERLIVVAKWDKDAWGQIAWICLCDCGEYIVVRSRCLRKGTTKSCGCLKRELTIARNFVHGQTGTPLYISWVHMKHRCSHKCTKQEARFYYDKGIRVCKEWLAFLPFFNWAKDKWSPGLEIDRKDTTKGYSPENCRFVSSKINNQNSIRSKIWFIKGRRFESAADAAKFFKCSSGHIYFMCHGRNCNGKYYPPHPNCYAVKKYSEKASNENI